MTTLTARHDVVTIDEQDEHDAATALEHGGHASTGARLVLKATDGREIDLPDRIQKVLRRVLTAVSTGTTVSVQRLPAELTTTNAAAELGISRPTLMRLVDAGKLPAHKVGTHTRLKTRDVLQFKRDRLLAQRAAFDELQRLEEELGEE